MVMGRLSKRHRTLILQRHSQQGRCFVLPDQCGLENHPLVYLAPQDHTKIPMTGLFAKNVQPVRTVFKIATLQVEMGCALQEASQLKEVAPMRLAARVLQVDTVWQGVRTAVGAVYAQKAAFQ